MIEVVPICIGYIIPSKQEIIYKISLSVRVRIFGATLWAYDGAATMTPLRAYDDDVIMTGSIIPYGLGNHLKKFFPLMLSHFVPILARNDVIMMYFLGFNKVL